MDEITIRSATRTDERALGRYGGALMRQHHAFDPPRFVLSENPEAGYGRFLVSQLEEPDTVVLVAERAGEVVGYAFASLEPMSWKDLRAACGFLHDVYVDAPWRERSIGTRALEFAEQWMRDRGLRDLRLPCRSTLAMRTPARYDCTGGSVSPRPTATS